MDIPPQLPKPKLCLLRKWENFAGYGFNLHSEKGKPGQFIGKVDPNSPADLGGLCPKDMLIEVNGINVEESSHSMVVGRVKSIPDRVELLVCHQDTYKYSKENGIQLSSAMLNIDEFTTPSAQPTAEELAAKNENAQASEVTNSSSSAAAAAEADATAAPAEAPDNSAAAAAAASLQAAVDAAGGAEFEEVRQEDLPERLRNVELRHQRSSGPNSSAEGSPRPSSSKRSSPPPSFTVAASSAAHAAAAPAPEATKLQQQQQQQRQQQQGQDPVAGVSLEEVRGRIGQNKRNQVKMSSSTFSEKYSVFQSL